MFDYVGKIFIKIIRHLWKKQYDGSQLQIVYGRCLLRIVRMIFLL